MALTDEVEIVKLENVQLLELRGTCRAPFNTWVGGGGAICIDQYVDMFGVHGHAFTLSAAFCQL